MIFEVSAHHKISKGAIVEKENEECPKEGILEEDKSDEKSREDPNDQRQAKIS